MIRSFSRLRAAFISAWMFGWAGVLYVEAAKMAALRDAVSVASRSWLRASSAEVDPSSSQGQPLRAVELVVGKRPERGSETEGMVGAE